MKSAIHKKVDSQAGESYTWHCKYVSLLLYTIPCIRFTDVLTRILALYVFVSVSYCQRPGMKLLFVLVVLILSQCLETKMAKKTRRPPYIRCFDSSECAPKMCCTMMVGRYKIPVCKPVRKLGAYCNDEELKYHANVTIHFPKLSVNLMDVFENTCPCGPDLYCDRGSRTCQPRSDNDIKR